MRRDQGFRGGVFSDRIDGGRAGAIVTLDSNGISARTDDGGDFFVRYGECQLEIGGFSGRMVFCRNRDRTLTIFCEERGFSAALREASAGYLDQALGQALASRSREVHRGRILTWGLLLGLAVCLVGGYFGVRAAARAAVHAVPVRVDKAIGSSALQAMDLGGPRLNDPTVLQAMQTLVERLEPHATLQGLDFQVHVVDSPLVNAFALPGGNIVIYSGLLATAESAEQVAGVLAHEMAHVTLRHGIERISQSLGLAAAINFLLGDVQGLIAAGAEIFQLASINSYSRGQEAAADREGARMLHAAAMDPDAMVQFFEMLKKEQPDLPQIAAWISTHPQHDARIAEIQALVKTLPPRKYERLDIDWTEVQRHVEKGEAEKVPR